MTPRPWRLAGRRAPAIGLPPIMAWPPGGHQPRWWDMRHGDRASPPLRCPAQVVSMSPPHRSRVSVLNPLSVAPAGRRNGYGVSLRIRQSKRSSFVISRGNVDCRKIQPGFTITAELIRHAYNTPKECDRLLLSRIETKEEADH